MTRGGSPMVLLAVIPDVLEADAGNVRAAGSGKVEAISAYHLVVAQPKEGSASNSLSLSFKDSERNVSAIGLALPASFYAQLSDEQKTALYAELGKYALIEFPADKTRDLEGQLAKNLVGVLAQ